MDVEYPYSVVPRQATNAELGENTTVVLEKNVDLWRKLGSLSSGMQKAMTIHTL
jgi:hypothetical protein